MRRIYSQSAWLLIGLSLACQAFCADKPKREPIGKVLGKTVYRDQVTREGHGSLAAQVEDVFYRPVQLHYLDEHRAELDFTEEELVFFTHYADEQQTTAKNAASPAAPATKTIKSELAEIESRLASDKLTDDEHQAALKQKEAAEKRFQTLREQCRDLMKFSNEHFFLGPKLARHLYEKYGGGRVLVSKFGVGAFDARYRWLAEREKLGEFEITDPQIRDAVKQAQRDDLASWAKQPRRGTSFVSSKPEDVDLVVNPPSLPKRKDAAAAKRDLVVTVLGQPIYLDQITPSDAPEKKKSLSEAEYRRWLRDYRTHWLLSRVSGQVLAHYAVRNKLSPTDDEIDALIAETARKVEEQSPADEDARRKLAIEAAFLQASSREWRTAKALYAKYGGRVAISSFGACTSFEGRNAVLKEYADAGDIRFRDSDLEQAFWAKTKDTRVQDVTLPPDRVANHFAVAPWELWRKAPAKGSSDK